MTENPAASIESGEKTASLNSLIDAHKRLKNLMMGKGVSSLADQRAVLNFLIAEVSQIITSYNLAGVFSEDFESELQRFIANAKQLENDMLADLSRHQLRRVLYPQPKVWETTYQFGEDLFIDMVANTLPPMLPGSGMDGLPLKRGWLSGDSDLG